MENKIALFDMDGTLAAMQEQLENDMKKLAGPNEPPFELNFEDPKEEYLLNRMRMIKSQKDWWLNLPKIESGFKILEIAKEIGFENHILTKGPRRLANAWSEKLLWCQKNISEDMQVTITFDKGLVYGRVLVDDYPEYMDRWLRSRPRGIGIMPKTKYNSTYYHTNVIMCDGTNYDQIKEELLRAYRR